MIIKPMKNKDKKYTFKNNWYDLNLTKWEYIDYGKIIHFTKQDKQLTIEKLGYKILDIHYKIGNNIGDNSNWEAIIRNLKVEKCTFEEYKYLEVGDNEEQAIQEIKRVYQALQSGAKTYKIIVVDSTWYSNI